jgi:hypothetical protein
VNPTSDRRPAHAGSYRRRRTTRSKSAETSREAPGTAFGQEKGRYNHGGAFLVKETRVRHLRHARSYRAYQTVGRKVASEPLVVILANRPLEETLFSAAAVENLIRFALAEQVTVLVREQSRPGSFRVMLDARNSDGKKLRFSRDSSDVVAAHPPQPIYERLAALGSDARQRRLVEAMSRHLTGPDAG